MAKEMLINVSEGEECRIALLEDGKLDELYMERTSSTSHVGNIYKGRVTNVEASIQAAFVDFGLGRNGFLHISDLMPTYFGRKGEDIQESVGRKMARRDRPPIQRCLRRGDEIIVQIIKEGIGTKGPTLSTYLSIPGRILVMMPGMGKMGVSKKIEDEEERKRLRTILDSLKPPKGVGFIIRTAGIGKSKAEIQRDLTYLSRLWTQIEKKRKSGAGPMELYTEGDLVTRTVRDVFSSDVDRIVVDSKEVAKQVKEVIKISAPRTKNKVETYEEPIPLFHKYNIERDIELMYSRHVPLPSGGSLVIDSTEAIVAIDVNSGKFRDHSDAEMTAFKTDMEAADEIPRQLKLRDLGGVIICDFIDLRYERHRRELEEKLHSNFKKDRAKTKVLRMSQFGIIEITRQRMRPSLKRSIYFDCPHCKGAGLVKTPESMSLDVMRRLAIAAHDLKVARIELSVCPDVGFYLLNKKRKSLASLEEETKKRIAVRNDPALGLDEMKFDLFDLRDGLVVIEELGLSQPPHTTQLGTRPHGPGRGRGRDRGRRGGQQSGGHQHHEPSRDRDDDRFELDETADANEVREEQREPVDPELVAQIAPKIVKDVAPGEEEEFEGEVIDIDDGPSELGDRPAGEWERRDDRRDDNSGRRGRRRRGRRGGRGRDREGEQGSGQQQPRQDQNRPQLPPATAMANYGDDDVVEPEEEGPSPGNELHPKPGRSEGRHDHTPSKRGRGGRGQGGGQGGRGRGGRDRGNRGQGGRPQGQHRQDQQGYRDPNRRDPEQVRREQSLGNRNPNHVEKPREQPQSESQPQGQGYGSQAAPTDAAEGQGYGNEEGGRRRRRRRGGRRHRRRRERERLERERLAAEAAGLPPPQQPAEFDDEGDDDFDSSEDSGGRDETPQQRQLPAPRESVEVDEEVDERVEEAVEVDSDTESDEDDSPAPKKKRSTRRPAKRKAPARTPPPKSATVSDDAPVVKTGSADKHLADDEPVDSPPPRRARARQDLDEIPDDYDD